MSALPERLELDCGPVRAIDLALYAAASSDHNPLHLDADTARAAGYERPLAHGMLTMAYATRLFTQRFGAGSLCALSVRFTGVAMLGDTLHFSATLERRDGAIGHYELRAVSSRNGAEVATGQARVVVATAAT